jgi:hypothetical protein
MADLQGQVASSAADLEGVWRNLSGRSITKALPSECYKRWESAAFLHTSLSGTIPLFAARKNAWRIVESLIDPKRIESEELLAKMPAQEARKPIFNFSHDGIEMDFASARHLALISYTCVSWSIYDRLSAVTNTRFAHVPRASGRPSLPHDHARSSAQTACSSRSEFCRTA